eukprot:scaffold123709_cov69-Phaeocystis_antarctica.AAC.2
MADDKEGRSMPAVQLMHILTNVLACHKEAVLVEAESTSVEAADVDLPHRSLYFLPNRKAFQVECLLREGLAHTEDAAHRLHDEVLIHRKTWPQRARGQCRGKPPKVSKGDTHGTNGEICCRRTVPEPSTERAKPTWACR